MRSFLLIGVLFAAIPALAGSAGLEHEFDLHHSRIIGYLPGAVVRPEGDTVVRDLPAAVSRTGVSLRLAFAALEVDFRPFMLNVEDKNGPKVVGLHYEAMFSPFVCQVADEGTWDIPWEHPCVAIGYAHRSEHNQDDGTFRWTFGNSVLGKARVWSSDKGRSSYWLWAQWMVSGAETPFALTSETDTVASRLEKRLWLLGTDSKVFVGERGLVTGRAEIRGSSEGVASFGKTLGYHHAVDVAVRSDTTLTLRLGIEAGMDLNLRKKKELGGSTYRLAFMLTLPVS